MHSDQETSTGVALHSALCELQCVLVCPVASSRAGHDVPALV